MIEIPVTPATQKYDIDGRKGTLSIEEFQKIPLKEALERGSCHRAAKAAMGLSFL